MRIAQVEKRVLDQVEVENDRVVELVDVVVMRTLHQALAHHRRREIRKLPDKLAHRRLLGIVLNVHRVAARRENGIRTELEWQGVPKAADYYLNFERLEN